MTAFFTFLCRSLKQSKAVLRCAICGWPVPSCPLLVASNLLQMKVRKVFNRHQDFFYFPCKIYDEENAHMFPCLRTKQHCEMIFIVSLSQKFHTIIWFMKWWNVFWKLWRQADTSHWNCQNVAGCSLWTRKHSDGWRQCDSGWRVCILGSGNSIWGDSIVWLISNLGKSSE